MLPVMPSSLRDFWFPWSLACAGLASAMLGNYAAGNGRRVMLTLTGLFFLAAWLSYVWGDPVRGPFANLTNPHNPENFTFVAGTNSRIYGVSQLKDGLDFSRFINVKSINIWVKKTWWSGLNVKAKISGADGKPIVVFDGKKVQYCDPNFDINYDDYAFEVADANKSPVFQLVIAKDYEAVYVNAHLKSQNGVLIMSQVGMITVSPEQAEQPQLQLDRIFKYPSYLHQGERN